MHRVAHFGGDVAISLGGSFFAGVIVAQAFSAGTAPAYGWLVFAGVGLLAGGYILKFIREDGRLW